MSENAENQNEKRIPINVRILPRTPSFYSHRTMLQRGEAGEVVMTFFEVIQPEISGSQEEARERLQKVGVTAESQVRITMPPKMFLAFARSVNQLASHLESPQEPLDEE
jgi:hypothetical protein